jgi:hypothetical protein
VSIILLLLACSAPSGSADTNTSPPWTDPTVDDDWSHLVPDADAAPRWTAAEVGAQVDRALALGLPGPEHPLATYLELLRHRDAGCPITTTPNGFEVFGICTAASGYSYSGVADLLIEDSRDEATPNAGALFVITAPADYFIVRPDGTQFGAGGTLTLNNVRDSAGLHTRSTISGTWQDEGDTGWLGSGFSGSLGISRNFAPEGSVQLSVDGSLTIGGSSLAFDRLELSPGACADGFRAGAIAVRQPDSSWFTLTFAGGCTACGQVTWQDGSPQGQACVDPAPLLAAAQLDVPL